MFRVRSDKSYIVYKFLLNVYEIWFILFVLIYVIYVVFKLLMDIVILS